MEAKIDELVCDFSESAQLSGESGANCGQRLRADLSAVRAARLTLESDSHEALHRARDERSRLLVGSLLGALSKLSATLSQERTDANLDAVSLPDGERPAAQAIDLDELNAELDFLKLLLSRCDEHKNTHSNIEQQAEQLKVRVTPYWIVRVRG